MQWDDYERIHVSRDGPILTLALNNGQVNAVDAKMHSELARVFFDAQDDTGSDLVVLTGTGGAFCAGGDTTWFQEQIERPDTFRAIAPEAKRIVSSLLELEKPLIARVNGPAAGLGATLALLCDIVIASDTAVIGDPHIKVGLVAGDGGALIWPQLVGFARAKEYLMTGEMLSAVEAERIGLINHVVPGSSLDEKVAEMSAKILGNPRWAVRWTKTVVNTQLREIAARLSDPAVAYEVLSNMTDDRREAVAAFIEKRPPKFSGS